MSSDEQAPVGEETHSLSLPSSIADTDTDTLSSGVSPRRKTVVKTHYDAHKYDSGANADGAASYVAVILGTEHIMPEKGKPFTAYKVRVQNKDGMKWVAIRRYSEFRTLMEKLKSVYGHSVVPHKFPPKKILGNLDPLHIDKRHMALQTWFNKVLQSPELGQCPELVSFLEDNKLDEGLVEISYEEAMVKLDLEKLGYMYRFTKKKDWKKNWFILRHGVLYKYRSHTDKHMYGKYIVSNCTVAEVRGSEHEFCFSVTPPKGKAMLFAALSEEDMAEWMKVLSGDVRAEDDDDHVGSKVLGVPLERVRYTDEIGLPIFLTCLLTYIEATALGMEELFTKPPDPVLISQIEEGELDFELIKDPHAVAGLIQLFLRELPQPVCTADLHDCFVGVYEISSPEIQVQALVGLVNCLPPLHYNLLYRLLSFLGELKSSGSQALFTHLANTFSVLLLRAPKNPSRPLDLKYEKLAVTAVTKLMIEHWQSIIPEPLEIDEQNLFSDDEFPEDGELSPRAPSEEESDREDEEDEDEHEELAPAPAPVASASKALSKKEQKMQEKADRDRQKQEEREKKKQEKDGKKKAPVSESPSTATGGLAFMSKKELKKREKAIREAEKRLERERKEQERKAEREKKAAEPKRAGLFSPKKKDTEGQVAPVPEEDSKRQSSEVKNKEDKEEKKEQKKEDKKDPKKDVKKVKKEEEKKEKKDEKKLDKKETKKEEKVEEKKEEKREHKKEHKKEEKGAEEEKEKKKKEHKKKEKKTEAKKEHRKKPHASKEVKAPATAVNDVVEDQIASDITTSTVDDPTEGEAPAVTELPAATVTEGKGEAEVEVEVEVETVSPAVEEEMEGAKPKKADSSDEDARKSVSEDKSVSDASAVSPRETDAAEEGETLAETAQEPGVESEAEGEDEDEEEAEAGEKPTPVLAQAPSSSRVRLVGPQKGRVVGPKRRRPTRGQPVTIATTTFYVPEEAATPKPKPLTPQQQMMMEMARVIKRK